VTLLEIIRSWGVIPSLLQAVLQLSNAAVAGVYFCRRYCPISPTLVSNRGRRIQIIEVPEQSDIARQMDQVVMGLSGVRTAGQVYLIDVRHLEPYPDQPFHQYPFEQLQEMAEDISRVGILSPILVRRVMMKLQILAGHNRWAAAKLAGMTHVPIMILEADDDQVALILTSTNLRQRERLLPSEKAFACKMQMDALKRQG
jgi:hypothetical protein